MARYVNPLIYTVLALVVVGGLGFAYVAGGIGGGSLVFLGILAVTAAVVVAIFVRRLSHPAESVDQMLYKTDHPTRTQPLP